MSAKNRVNPDHYKVAGRDPQGETIRHDREKQKLARQRNAPQSGNFIPGGDHTAAAMAAKQGMTSGSKKAATSHYGTRAMPATRKVAGAFGREGTRAAGKSTKARTTGGAKAKRTARATTRGKTRRAA